MIARWSWLCVAWQTDRAHWVCNGFTLMLGAAGRRRCLGPSGIAPGLGAAAQLRLGAGEDAPVATDERPRARGRCLGMPLRKCCSTSMLAGITLERRATDEPRSEQRVYERMELTVVYLEKSARIRAR